MLRSRRRPQKPPRLTGDALKRLAVAGIFSAVAGWLTIAVSGAAMMRTNDPALAIEFQPKDARAKAKLAENVLVENKGNPAALPQIADLTRAALRRDPTVASAWRTLAMVEGLRGKEVKSRKLFHFAEAVSPRDVPTQLWMIEDRVRADDIPGALAHYDLALRSSGAIGDSLLPILIQAAADDAIVEPLAKLLQTQPPWRHLFVERVGALPDPDNLVRLLERIAPTASPQERQLYNGLIGQLVAQQHFGQARRLYNYLTRASTAQAFRNGDFDKPNAIPPFDWELINEGDLRAEIGNAPEGLRGNSLRLSVSAGAGGTLARQLLNLAPGTYQLGLISLADVDAAPVKARWKISCVGSDSHLLDAELPMPGRPVRTVTTIVVPAGGCAAQWLSFDAIADFESEAAGGWIDSISVQRGTPS